MQPARSVPAGVLAGPSGLATPSLPSPRVIGLFLLGFGCVFAVLALPLASFGASYSRAFSAVANTLVSALPSHPVLDFRFEGSRQRSAASAWGTDSWRTQLVIQNFASGRKRAIPYDLRGIHYLPAAAFIALSVATPVRSRRRKLLILGVGLAVLVPLSLFLTSLTLIPALRGGELQIISLPQGMSDFVALFHRAFVAHPGMVYAIPVLLWWSLLSSTRPRDPAESTKLW